MMKTRWVMGTAVMILSLAVSRASALSYNLADLVAGQTVISFGDKLFGNWDAYGDTLPGGLGAIEVTPGYYTISGEMNIGLQFSGDLMSAEGQSADVLLKYTVQVAPGSAARITGIGQQFQPSGRGLVYITETAFNAASEPIGGSQISIDDTYDPPGEIDDNDFLTFLTPQAMIWVVKDINLSPDSGERVGTSWLVQTFSQTSSVPDGGSSVMLLGLGCLALCWRKSRSV